VVLTAHGMPEHERASREAGADGHIVRPLRKPALLDAIAAAVRAPVTPSGERVHVDVTSTIAPLVPNFLANRGKDVQSARAALKRRDYHGLWVLAHTMKGLGSSYGFDAISDIGVQLERAALAHEEANALRAIEALESYLGRVDYAVSA
jgi:HPt (histidine-containing phosphotransfer) domain-containing protein